MKIASAMRRRHWWPVFIHYVEGVVVLSFGVWLFKLTLLLLNYSVKLLGRHDDLNNAVFRWVDYTTVAYVGVIVGMEILRLLLNIARSWAPRQPRESSDQRQVKDSV